MNLLIKAQDAVRRMNYHLHVSKEQGRMMPQRFKPLATYNSEVARGIVHTSQWSSRMALLQNDFDEWVKQEYKEEWDDK